MPGFGKARQVHTHAQTQQRCCELYAVTWPEKVGMVPCDTNVDASRFLRNLAKICVAHIAAAAVVGRSVARKRERIL